MAAQAAIASKHALSAISFTGTALSITPRGKDAKNVLSWIAPGTTSLDDIRVDFSYREPTTTRKTIKGTLRTFVPKTITDVDTSLVSKVGENIVSSDFSFPENATSAEKQKALDVHLTTLGSTEFRDALISGDVMY